MNPGGWNTASADQPPATEQGASDSIANAGAANQTAASEQAANIELPPVRRRHTYFVQGFDPRGPRHYRRIYEGIGQTNRPHWHSYELSNYSFDREHKWLAGRKARSASENAVETEYRALDWSPAIKAMAMEP